MNGGVESPKVYKMDGWKGISINFNLIFGKLIEIFKIN